jgi:hypothetical protein
MTRSFLLLLLLVMVMMVNTITAHNDNEGTCKPPKTKEEKPSCGSDGDTNDGMKKNVLTADYFIDKDEKLTTDVEFKQVISKYKQPASKESVDKTKKALEDKKFQVIVVNTPAEALQALKDLIKDGTSISNGYSLTLDQIGYTDYIKSIDHKVTNHKGKAVAAQMAGKMDEYGTHIAAGANADIFISGASSITEDGEIFAADATGSRIIGWYTAKKLVIVAGSNKIVKNAEEGNQRLHNYQAKLEAARIREVYKAPGTSINNVVGIRGGNPRAPTRVVVIIINKSLGF